MNMDMRVQEPVGDLCDITCIILTYNEAIHIARAVQNARSFCKEVVVVDSFSKDGTVEIARAEGARVLQNPWVNYSRQFNWGLEHADVATEWVLRLDADEIIEDDLVARIRSELPKLPVTTCGISLDRKHIFMDRWVRHGGRYPLRMIRLWRHGQGVVEDRWMDEHVTVNGDIAHMEGGFSDWSLRDISFLIEKHNGYATREAIDALAEKYGLFGRSGSFGAEGDMPAQAKLKRWLKNRVYNQLPLSLGPLTYFLYRYFVQLGFLDGRTGFIYHFNQALWYRTLVDCKKYELEQAIAHCSDNEARIAVLTERTGLRLDL
jgi:glycosyltransferase involved in cell wall biosynthesis